jgi:hypothetical protein
MTADLGPETTAPVTVPATAPAANANGWHNENVSVSLNASDECSGVSSAEYSTDGGATWVTYANAFTISTEGTTTILYRSTDRAGNAEPAQTLVVKIDKTAPTLSLSADPSVIWPANGKTISVNITGRGADAVSGLAGVSYAVTDEYGAPLSIAPRSLAGAQSAWDETLGIEARREGGDRDGRLYRIVATATDAAGNTATASTTVTVPHDQRGS